MATKIVDSACYWKKFFKKINNPQGNGSVGGDQVSNKDGSKGDGKQVLQPKRGIQTHSDGEFLKNFQPCSSSLYQNSSKSGVFVWECSKSFFFFWGKPNGTTHHIINPGAVCNVEQNSITWYDGLAYDYMGEGNVIIGRDGDVLISSCFENQNPWRDYLCRPAILPR